MYVVSTVIIVAFPIAYVSCDTLQDTHIKQIQKNKVINFFITLTFVYIAKIVIIFNIYKCFTIFNFCFTWNIFCRVLGVNQKPCQKFTVIVKD